MLRQIIVIQLLLNKRLILVVMRVRLVTQIQWIFQMMIYHSNIIDGQNLKL